MSSGIFIQPHQPTLGVRLDTRQKGQQISGRGARRTMPDSRTILWQHSCFLVSQPILWLHKPDSLTLVTQPVDEPRCQSTYYT